MKLVNTIRQKGFTLIELLIVIVVIGILASITIVSYNGVQNRAKLAKNLSNAAAIRDSAEAYNGINGVYPVTKATLTATTNIIPTPNSVAIVSNSGNPLAVTPVTALNSANGASSIQYDITGGGTGARIVYWDPGASKPSTTILYLGSATAASTYSVTP